MVLRTPACGSNALPVDHHLAPDGTEGYYSEVFNKLGDTIAVTSVSASAPSRTLPIYGEGWGGGDEPS